MSTTDSSLADLSINTIRTLSMDAVERAKSGHPGTPMALAPVAYVLWTKFLRFDPEYPEWPDRDRFILSCGHASMLLYSLIHLSGIRTARGSQEPAIALNDIRRFRQEGSRCAGHPEFGEAAGIETTTGPLGQGVGNSVGMAAAAAWLGARYNRPGQELFRHRVFALCSDGDLMEGVASEAASLAGHWKLGNLCWIYDDNQITIEGRTDLAFSENVPQRFEALGWRTYQVDDANDLEQLEAAFEWFESSPDERPALITVKSIIGYGAPHKANSHAAHGAPLGPEEIRGAKRTYGWPEDAEFLVPPEVPQHFAQTMGVRGNQLSQAWESTWNRYGQEHPAERQELEQLFAGRLPSLGEEEIPVFDPDGKGLATRVSSGKVLNAVASRIPWLIGGSADLAPSNMTKLEGEEDFRGRGSSGRGMHFGIREHAMASIANGMALSGLRPFVATFFVFTDYLRPAMRLAAMMSQKVLYILTHDSIGLGEDGPTHQPVEHLAACRAIPGLSVVRPADANEVAVAYRVALEAWDGPAALVLTRQAVPTVDRSKYGSASGASRGGYVLHDSASKPKPDVILIGTGSEVPICLAAAELLERDGIAARVVSLPCFEWFDEQSQAYRDNVLPPEITARVGVEAGVEQGWSSILGPEGRFIGVTSFGASAPYRELYHLFGITAEQICYTVHDMLRA